MIRVARRLRLSGHRRLGFFPVGAGVPLARLLPELAAVLASLGGARATVSAPVVDGAEDPPDRADAPADDGDPDGDFSLVDLSGLEASGRHVSVAESLDAVVLVAEAGRVHEDALRRARDAFGEDRTHGVLLLC